MTSHHSVKPSLWPSAISFPSAAFGGWMPKPRNERKASIRIAAATMSVVKTTIGPTQFGRMCRRMMRMSLAPAAFAASTNSFSRSDRKRPRTMRASPTQNRNARMIPIFIGWEIGIVIGADADLGVVRAEVHGRGEQDGDAREREDEVGEPHQQVVDPAAVVAGDGADRRPDRRREDRDEERDPERGADAVDDPAQVVTAELVGAEDVPALERRRLREAGDGSGLFEVDLVVAVRGDAASRRSRRARTGSAPRG